MKVTIYTIVTGSGRFDPTPGGQQDLRFEGARTTKSIEEAENLVEKNYGPKPAWTWYNDQRQAFSNFRDKYEGLPRWAYIQCQELDFD